MLATDMAKLQELILYIAEQSEGDPRFSQTKLCQILFYADFLFYQKTGRSITGQQYRKAPEGPQAADAKATLQALKDEGSLAMAHREYHGRAQQRPVALREPELESFSGEEIALVNDVIRDLWGQNAAEVSQISPDFMGWHAAATGEVIPYETILVDTSPLTEEEEAWARQLALTSV